MDREVLAGGFAASAAELREQLSMMAAASQLLERTAGSREMGYVAAMNQSICRMLRTVSRMELAHRLTDENNPRACYEAVDLGSWAEDLARRMQSVLGAAGISLGWEVPSALMAHVDGELLSHMVLEMITFAAESGGELQFSVGTQGGKIRMVVRAEGTAPSRPRVPECLAEEIQDLGLAMVRKAAALHGGTLVTCLEGGVCRSLTVILPQGLDEPVSRMESPRSSMTAGGFDPVVVAFSHLLPEKEFLQTCE